MTADSTPAPVGAKPIHVHQINGRPVRYFMAPNGSEAFPWIAFHDLVGCALLPRNTEERFTSDQMIAPFIDDMRLIDVAGGKTLIGPLSMAQGFMGAMEELFPQSKRIDRGFIEGLQSAVSSGYPGMSEKEEFELIIKMGRYHLGTDDPVRRSIEATEEGDAA